MFRSLCALLSATGAVLALAGPAQAVTLDKWIPWTASPSGATIRSLDFIGPVLYGGSEGDGVFSAPLSVGPWTQLNGGLDAPGATSVRQVVANSGQLYAATTAGLYRAPAGGGNWSPVGQGAGTRKLNGGGVQSIVFNSPTDMVVGTAAGSPTGVLYSSDGGENWDRASGLPSNEAVFALTTGPLGTPIYAAASDGVFISLDQGRSWTLSSDGIPPSEAVLRIAVAPDDPTHLYAATTSGVYRSYTGGALWTDAQGSGDSALPSGGKRALLLTPALNGQFGAKHAMVGTDKGVWATLDDGDHWGQMSPDSLLTAGEMNNRIVWSLGLGFAGPSLMAGTQGFGVYSLPIQPLAGGTPAVIGTPKAGAKLSAGAPPHGFTGTAPFFFTYQWRRGTTNASCATAIPGATAPTYAVPDSDADGNPHYYSVQITARNMVSPAASVKTTTCVGGVIPGTDNNSPYPVNLAGYPSITPTINQVGTPTWGQTYTISNGSWRSINSTSVSPTFSYQWQRCAGANCVDLPGETKGSYTTTPADVGKFVRANITATNLGSSATRLAGDSATIIEKTPVNTDAPKVVGDPVVGTVLSSSAGAWTANNPTFARRWLRCEADGLGCNPAFNPVTTPTYTLSAADVGKRLKLEVTAVVADPNQNRTAVALSAPTEVVTDVPGPTPPPTPPPTPTPTPPKTLTIKVSAPKKVKIGSTLSVPSKVKGYKKLTYQWLRNGKKIRKATKRTYKLTRADRGKKINCRITLTNAAGKKTTVLTKAIKAPKK